MQESVKKGASLCEEVLQNLLVVWKCVSMRHGAPSVIMAGLSMMPMLSANSWDSLKLVIGSFIAILINPPCMCRSVTILGLCVCVCVCVFVFTRLHAAKSTYITKWTNRLALC